MIKTIITKEHIENGKRKDNKCCPIALSFQNHKEVKHVLIFDNHAWLFMKKKKGQIKTFMQDFNLTDEMKTFIKKFDNKEIVQPQTFIFNNTQLRKEAYL